MHEVERLQAQLMACQLGPPLSIDEADLDIGDTLGTGGFSVVYRGTWFCTPVAIKKWFASDTHQLEIRGEIMTNAVLYDMPNIPLPIAKCTSIAVDIARAFCYLHTRIPQVIHRDLKPQNVLLDRAWKVKLCDFGLAGSTKVDAGTPAYMAPELLGTEGLYTDKVDVYAFGVLFNEMLSRRPPFAGSDGNRALELAKTGQRPEIPLSAPPAAKALIQSCWHGEPTERPTFRQINADLMALQGT